MEEHDNKKRTAVWLTPGVIRRMDGWLEEDNCKTRSEFIEKALRFYMGCLATEDTSEYLSRALADTLRGTLADNENRLRTLLFKLCVEVNMMGHTVAAHFRADPVNRRELRAYAVDEVLRTNGEPAPRTCRNFPLRGSRLRCRVCPPKRAWACRWCCGVACTQIGRAHV